VSFIQGENSEQWQPWQQEDFKHDTYGRKTHHSRRWLTKNYPGPEVTSLDFNYDFDSNSKALTVSQIKASGAATQSIVDTRNNQRISHVTPLNETWHYHYDALNRLTGMMDPLGYTTSHSYDDYQAAGANRVIVTSPLGYKTRTTLDAKHQPIHQHDTFDNQWRHLSSHRYDGLGKVIAQTDINQLTSTTEFDELERPLVHVDGYGNTTEFSYDDYLLTTTLYLNKHKIHQKLSEPWDVLTRTRFYPNFDNPRESHSGFIEHTIKYSGFKKKIEESNSIIDRYSSTAKDTVTRRFCYDASLNVTEENTFGFNGTQFAIKYTHDIFNHAVTKKKTLHENNATSASAGETFVYDADGQLIEKQSPVSASGKQLVTHFSYNKNGQNIKVVLPSGKAIIQTYNALGLPNKSSWSREGGLYEMTHEYDADRRLTSVKDGQGQSITFSYLDNGFLTGMRYPDGQSIEVTYDDKNRKLTEKNLGGPVHQFHYDAKDSGKVSSLRSGDLSVNYRYGIDDNGVKHQLIERVSDHPKTGETVESIIYGSQGIPIKTQVQNQKSGAVYEVDYVFNPRRQLMRLSSHHHKGHSKPESAQMHYNYNALNQLIYEKVTNLDTSRELHYQYDANGNLILEKEMGDGTLSSTAFVYNPLDQLVEISSDYAPGSGNLSYDQDGRLTKDHRGLEYAYDDKGYLLSVNTPSSRIHYDYWPSGELSHRKVAGAVASPPSQIYHDLEKNIVAVTSGDHWRYLLKDNQNILASTELFARTGSGKNTATDNTYTESTSVHENTMDEWFMINHSVGALLSETGNLSTQHYMAYGKPLNADLPDTPDFFWHQNYSDTLSDLVYFKSRFYSPTLKRFITPDNLLIDNRYRYAKSNPLFYYDPTGHSVRDANYGVGIAAIVFGIVGVGLALPSGGATLTLSGDAAVAAAAASAASGAALVGSQIALNAGNKELAKSLQYTSIGFGAAGLILSAGSLAPAINAFRVTGQFSLASHWYNTTPIWESIAARVPGAMVAEGGTGLVLTGRTTGEGLTESAQHAATLTDSQWVRVLGSDPTVGRITSTINRFGQVPPEFIVNMPSPYRSSVYAISDSLATTPLASMGLYKSYTSTDTEDTDKESTSGKADKHNKTESAPAAQVLNWTEIRAQRNTGAPTQTLANDAFSSGAKEPFDLFGCHR
jgi:RHS repeat-associated protein